MPKQIALPMGDDEELDTLPHDLPDTHSDEPPRRDGAPTAPPTFHGDGEPMTFPLSSTPPPAPPLSLVREFDVSLLALSKVRGVGTKTLRALYERFPDLSQVWQTDLATLADILHGMRVKDARMIATTILDEQEVLRTEAQRTLHRFRSESISLVARHDPAFPKRLAERPDGPYWLFVEGKIEALHAPLIGIVGTRRPSPIGIQATERLTALICREGFGVVSGLAEGIDAAAHRVGLYYQAPQVGVLGTGIDIIFPASTEGIRQRIVETGGAVITEYMPGDNYSRANFVQRNRIQAALALALCPVESQEQSGTAHTVRFTEQYGRPLFGVVRGEPSPQNDMVRLLTTARHPTFDLEQRERITALIDWLRSVTPAESVPAARRQVNGRWFFQDLLRLVDDIVADVPVLPEDLAWFQAQISARVSAPEAPQQRKSKQQGRG